MKLGYIGIGIMGGHMAANLLKAGHAITIYNRTAEKCSELAQAGALVAANPAEVAEKSEVVFINVPDTPDVDQVLFGPQGVSDAAREGLIVIDNSTIAAGATKTFAQRIEEKGCAYLDAPVSGGDVGAQKGTLAIMVGGEKDAFDKCLPLFEVLGSTIVHVGAAGMGQTCKACNQVFAGLHMVACCEGIALAKQAGLDPKTMVEVVSTGAAGSWALSNLGPKIVAGDMDPGFMIDLISKDLRLVLELGEEANLALPATALAQQLFHSARAQGHGRLGTQALSKVLESLGDFQIKG